MVIENCWPIDGSHHPFLTMPGFSRKIVYRFGIIDYYTEIRLQNYQQEAMRDTRKLTSANAVAFAGPRTPELKPPTFGWHGVLKSLCITLYSLVSFHRKKTCSPAAAVIFIGKKRSAWLELETSTTVVPASISEEMRESRVGA